MTLQALLPDLILLLALAVFTITGAWRGFLRTLAGLVSLIVSLVGAKLLADQFSVQVSQWLAGKLEPVIAQKLADGVSSAASSGSAGGLDGIFSLLPGAQNALNTATDAAAGAIAETIAQTFGWILLFVVAFLALRVICWFLTHLLYGLDHLPGIHFANHLLGALLGFLKGGIALFLVVMVLRSIGVLPDETVQNSVLLRLFSGLSSVH